MPSALPTSLPDLSSADLRLDQSNLLGSPPALQLFLTIDSLVNVIKTFVVIRAGCSRTCWQIPRSLRSCVAARAGTCCSSSRCTASRTDCKRCRRNTRGPSRPLPTPNQPSVILSGVNVSRSEAFTESKDPECRPVAQAMQGILTATYRGHSENALQNLCGFRQHRSPSTPGLLRFAQEPLTSG